MLVMFKPFVETVGDCWDCEFEFDDELDCEYDDALSTLVDGSRANGLTVVSSIE